MVSSDPSVEMGENHDGFFLIPLCQSGYDVI